MTAAIYIYLAEVVHNIGVFLAAAGVIGLTIYAVCTLLVFVEEDKYHGKNWTWIAPTACIAISCLVPSTKTMYMMAGVVIGEKVLESKVGKQLEELIEYKLDEEIEKMKKGEKK
jgi:hypothetical protein